MGSDTSIMAVRPGSTGADDVVIVTTATLALAGIMAYEESSWCCCWCSRCGAGVRRFALPEHVLAQ